MPRAGHRGAADSPLRPSYEYGSVTERMLMRGPSACPANAQVSGLVRGAFRLIGSLHHHDARLDLADAACTQRHSRRGWADLQGEPRHSRSTPAGVPGARQRELTPDLPEVDRCAGGTT